MMFQMGPAVSEPQAYLLCGSEGRGTAQEAEDGVGDRERGRRKGGERGRETEP
jgi:hypothetical protein